CVTDRYAIDGADDETADHSRHVEQDQRVSIGIEDPGRPNEDGCDTDHYARTEAIDQISVERYQPGLDENENRERPLDRIAAPVIFLIYRVDERLPSELEIGYTQNAGAPEHQLTPAP